MQKEKVKHQKLIPLILLLAGSCLLLSLPASAALIRTTLTDDPAPALNQVSFTAYLDNDDNQIVTEDSLGNVADSNQGYIRLNLMGRNWGICQSDSTQLTGIAAASSYQIWIASATKAAQVTLNPVGGLSPANIPTASTTLNESSYLAVPANLAVTTAPARLNLSWNAVSDATEYRLYRRVDDNNPATPITIVYQRIDVILGSGNTTFTDFSATDSTYTYYYLITAVSDPGTPTEKRSTHSNEVGNFPQAGDPVTLSSIALTSASASIRAGQSTNLTATGTYSDLSTQNITGSVSWTINPAAATISAGTFSTSAPGSYTVTANQGAIISNPVTITVTSSSLSTVTITSPATDVEAGSTINLTLTGRDRFNNDIATETRSFTVQTTIGSQTITQDLTDPLDPSNTKSGSITLNILPAALSTINVSPETATLEQTDSITFTATYLDQYNNPKYPETTLTYTANTLGANEVYFSRDSITKKAIVTVIPKISSIPISQNNQTIENDTTLTVTAVDQNNQVVNLSTYSLTPTFSGTNVTNNTFSTANQPDGSYTVTATLTLTNRTLTATATLHLNKQAPNIKVQTSGKDLTSNSIISSQPNLTIELSDGNEIDPSSIKVLFDGVDVKASDLTISPLTTPTTSLNVTYQASTALTEGTHSIQIKAKDKLNKETTLNFTNLSVYSTLAVQGTFANYPNPVKFSTQPTTIKYTLTASSDIKINIYDLTGKLVFSNLYSSGSEGGRAGENKVSYDGKNLFNEILPNGVYHYFILDSQGKILAKGQLAVLD